MSSIRAKRPGFKCAPLTPLGAEKAFAPSPQPQQQQQQQQQQLTSAPVNNVDASSPAPTTSSSNLAVSYSATDVPLLAQSLLREFLACRHYDDTRSSLQTECPRTETEISKRSLLLGKLGMAPSGADVSFSSPRKGGGPTGASTSVLETLLLKLLAINSANSSNALLGGSFNSDLGNTTNLSATTTVDPLSRSTTTVQLSNDGSTLQVGEYTFSTSKIVRSDTDDMSLLTAAEIGSVDELDFDNKTKLGEGVSGKVYSGVHRPTGIRVAVKEIPITGDAEFAKQILAELHVLWSPQLKECPYIVKFYGAFFQKGYIMLCLELMDMSLEGAFCSSGPVDEIVLAAIALQLLEGCRFLHDKCKRLHRDIKPANILCSKEGYVKFTDFGIASERLETLKGLKRDTFCGTIAYMHPDRAYGNCYGQEADTWALGLSLCRGALGKLPVDTSRGIFGVASLKDSPPRLPTDGRYSPQFQNFVSLCLQGDASQVPSCASLLEHEWLKGMTFHKSVKIVKEWLQVAETLSAHTTTASGNHQGPYQEAINVMADLDSIITS